MILSLKQIIQNAKNLFIFKLSELILFFEDKNKNTKYRNILLRKLGFKIGQNVIIDKSVTFFDPNSIQIGNNVLIRQGCYLDHHIVIEDYVTISRNVSIIVAGHKPGTMEYVMKPVKVCKYAWIGANVVILPGVEIGTCACVAAGAVVTKNVAPFTVVGGIPASFIRYIEKPDVINNQFGNIIT